MFDENVFPQSSLVFDVAIATDIGARNYQEDCLAEIDFGKDSNFTGLVLSDGMGGHSAGDIASNLIVSTFQKTISEQAEVFLGSTDKIAETLRDTCEAANAKIREHQLAHEECHDMGATLLSVVFDNNQLQWVSVGDSPLFRFSNAKLSQLNEDHSLACQIDLLAKIGQLTEEQAQNHPDRNVLSSALTGQRISRIDCPEVSTVIEAGDIFIIASDGLQTLCNNEIETVVSASSGMSAQDITDKLMREVLSKKIPDQDNISIAVVKTALA